MIQPKNILFGVIVGLVPMFLFIPFLEMRPTEDSLVASTNEIVASINGDANGDGKISSADYLLVRYYILGSRDLSEEQKIRADINNDGLLNDIDRRLLQGVVMGYIKLEEASRLVFGDVDNDGSVKLADFVKTKRFVDKVDYPTSRQAFVADVDLSGTIDTADTNLLRLRVTGAITVLPAKYGDLNGDLSISLADSVILDQAINNLIDSTPLIVSLGNVFQDTNGKLDGVDVRTINKFILKTIYRLPVVSGDLNQDMKVTLSDVVLLDRIVAGTMSGTDHHNLAGDVYIDGKLTIDDTSTLRRYILGSITELPVSPDLSSDESEDIKNQ